MNATSTGPRAVEKSGAADVRPLADIGLTKKNGTQSS